MSKKQHLCQSQSVNWSFGLVLVLEMCGRNTTNLFQHLRKHHQAVLDDLMIANASAYATLNV